MNKITPWPPLNGTVQAIYNIINIFSILKKGGIINSKKGAQGGYFLARTAADITVGEILNILEGDLKIVSPSEERNDIECFSEKLEYSIRLLKHYINGDS